MTGAVLTFGHSTLSFDAFAGMLSRHGCGVVVDVRSSPFSRWQPQFNRPALARACSAVGIGYQFAGEALGGRPADQGLYRDGVADYEAMARQPRFREAVGKVAALAAAGRRPTLVCCEKDPATCHRFLLVGRALAEAGVQVRHVLTDGTSAIQDDILGQILRANRIEADLFGGAAQAEADAYRAQARRHAFHREAAARAAPGVRA